ncbi:MAG: hypothetical protein JO188_06925 [Hyphomicrobiales bacterium]|nr:hypothetical protein [Hyphomicrobiales bacterium]
MITVVFLTRDAEELLLRSLAALARFSTQGLIGDVVVADLCSRDATLQVAEAAGCTLVEKCATEGAALERAVKHARKEWLFVLRPGDIVEALAAATLRDHLARNARTRLPLAFLAFPAASGRVRRALIGKVFTLSGLGPKNAVRLLVHRRDARLLADPERRWPGARAPTTIMRAAEPGLHA